MAVLPESDNDKTLSETFGSFFMDNITRMQNTFQGNIYPFIAPDEPPPSFKEFHCDWF